MSELKNGEAFTVKYAVKDDGKSLRFEDLKLAFEEEAVCVATSKPAECLREKCGVTRWNGSWRSCGYLKTKGEI